MSQLPTGTVTFLFTDIEGSTALWERDQEAMQAALKQHDAILRQAIEAADGFVFKTVGDAFCSTFSRAQAGLDAAVEAQRALSAGDWSMLGEAAPLRVRMALHTGEAEERDRDYFGPTVNRVARLASAGHGGQVLVSGVAQNLVRDRLPAGCTLRDCGEHRLKDLQHSERVYQLLVEGLPDVTTALLTAEALHPRDRIMVAGAEAEGEGWVGRAPAEGDLWQLLEAAVISDTPTASVTLTPEQAAELAQHKPRDLRELRLGRIAEWSQPRYRIDGRFVGLTLLIDQGEESVQGRWQASEGRYTELGDMLAETQAQALVVLGPPGAGKSTLLRRLELDTAIAELRGEGSGRISFFVPLTTYAPALPGDPPPAPGPWLAERWAARYPDLPPLDALLAEGRMILLFDALNEMPASGEAEYRKHLGLWKAWLQRLALDHPGNQAVFSCRSLDYSQPLSTPDLRVPQVRIEALSDPQIEDFLRLYSPLRWREIWASLEGRPQLEVLRSPYFLKLLVDQVEATGEIPRGRSELFTGFVRQSLRREIERGHKLFEPGALLESRDVRQMTSWRWKTPWALPERGPLLTKLSDLAYAMQSAREEGERSQIRIDYDDALDLLETDQDEDIVAAGAALAVLDEDEAAGELMFVHQLVQEYFAARELARHPDPDLVARAWRADAVEPGLADLIAGLDPADPLPPLPSTGWEETQLLAATMSEEPESLVRDLMAANLALAGRAAAQVELASSLPEALLEALRADLVARSRDPEADLRERIDCGLALGKLGDPRFERCAGPEGAYLLPPMVDIPAGRYPIGADEPLAIFGNRITSHMPRHAVAIEAFALGRFAVTNAEWACFMAAGGYDDTRWWPGEAARAWQGGETTAAGMHASIRFFRDLYRAEPAMLQAAFDAGAYDEEILERWQLRLAMSEAELEAHLRELYPGGRITAPRFWDDERFRAASQPVVGICWYEARAYCLWLSAQTGQRFRLPSEVEWEAAARGLEGRRFAWGDAHDLGRANTIESHVMRPSPVGIFPAGDSPEGICDLGGNSGDLTASAWGRRQDEADFGYPYDAKDGREAAEATDIAYVVARGGGWYDDKVTTLSACRNVYHLTETGDNLGFRLRLESE